MYSNCQSHKTWETLVGYVATSFFLEWLDWSFFPFFTCTDASNNLLTGELADRSSSSNVKLNCTFLSGFNGSAHCTVQYGTDPTYMNLPYSAESTETGTAGDTVSVVLRERLNSLTVYYYTVSAVSGDVTVRVQGTFTTPQYSKYMHLVLWYVIKVCYNHWTFIKISVPQPLHRLFVDGTLEPASCWF